MAVNGEALFEGNDKYIFDITVSNEIVVWVAINWVFTAQEITNHIHNITSYHGITSNRNILVLRQRYLTYFQQNYYFHQGQKLKPDMISDSCDFSQHKNI